MKPESPVLKISNPVQGMPPHPTFPDQPVLWADSGDRWLFRRSTNVLHPKALEQESPNAPMVRYVVCAIQRGSRVAGERQKDIPRKDIPIDWVIWQEIEQLQEDRLTVLVTPILCFGPSRVNGMEYLQASLEAAMAGFKVVYKDPVWISQYESGLSALPTENPKFIQDTENWEN